MLIFFSMMGMPIGWFPIFLACVFLPHNIRHRRLLGTRYVLFPTPGYNKYFPRIVAKMLQIPSHKVIKLFVNFLANVNVEFYVICTILCYLDFTLIISSLFPTCTGTWYLSVPIMLVLDLGKMSKKISNWKDFLKIQKGNEWKTKKRVSVAETTNSTKKIQTSWCRMTTETQQSTRTKTQQK